MQHAQMANLDIAKQCLGIFMLENRQYSGNMAPVEACDQYLCRAYFALGQLVSEQSKTLKVSVGEVVGLKRNVLLVFPKHLCALGAIPYRRDS